MMKMKQFRELTAKVSDDAELWFQYANYGGRHREVEPEDITIVDEDLILIEPPYICDDD